MIWLRRLAVLLALVVLLGFVARLLIGRSTRARLEAARDSFEASYGARTPADLEPEPVPESDNIALLLLALAEDTGSSVLPRTVESDDLFATPLASWSADQIEVAREVVSVCGSLDRYRQLGERHLSDFGFDYSLGWSMPLPPVVEIIGVARCAALHGLVGLAEHDVGRFEVSHQALVHTAQSLHNEPLLLTQLVGLAVRRYQHYLLQAGVLSGELGEETLRDLSGLEGGPSARETIARSLQAEALLVASMPSRDLVRGLLQRSPRPFESLRAYLMEPRGDAIRTATLENRARDIEALEGDATDMFRQLDAGTFYDASNLLQDQLAPNIEDVMLKVFSADTADLLARLAVDVAASRPVSADDPPLDARPTPEEPMTGEPIVWSVEGEALVVSAPAAAALWNERGYSREGSPAPLFEWRVMLTDPH